MKRQARYFLRPTAFISVMLVSTCWMSAASAYGSGNEAVVASQRSGVQASLSESRHGVQAEARPIQSGPESGVGAQSATSTSSAAGRPLRLVELFTSHGCSSCPPADRLLGEMLAQDASLMALEYHVDYWDSLVHGDDGSWKDPFSKPEFTKRQRDYHAAGLTGRPGVYTPQVVVNGRYVSVGSDGRRLRQALQQDVPAQLHIALDVSPAGNTADDEAGGGARGETLSIRVGGEETQLSSLQGAAISLVRYIDQARTEITGGENNRKQLVNHRIVFDVITLGQVGTQSPMQYHVEAPAEGQGCIVMVQNAMLTPVLAAAQCP